MKIFVRIAIIFFAHALTSRADAMCRVESDSNKYCEQSLFVLVSNPASNEGHLIRMTGYMRKERDGFVLYFNRERADLGLNSESIVLVAEDPEEMHLDRFKEHLIRINGKFSTVSLPKDSRRAAKLEVLLPAFPAPKRASHRDQDEFISKEGAPESKNLR